MTPKPHRILAIDPGFRRLGYALFENGYLVDYGVRQIPRGRTLKDTFLAIEQAVEMLIADRHSQSLAFEQTVFSQIRHNIRLTLVVHIIRRIAGAHRIPAFAYNPRTIRKAVCNDGNASARQLAKTIAAFYPETRLYLESNRRWRERQFQTIFDAVACAMAHRQKSQPE